MSEIDIRVEGRAGRITLNRPETLNALTSTMLQAIDRALEDWRHDDSVRLVMIDAAGDRAFAAGGDIIDLYNTGRAGDFEFGQRFWAHEYGLNARIAAYPKPYVAFMHGFVMGGGVGVSAHGSQRIVTDNTQVAMPECGIGLVPDVGGSWILANAPGHCGEYLGMTGTRMGPADAIYAGFADTYVPADQWDDLKFRLIESADVGVIASFATTPPTGDLQVRQVQIDTLFSRETAQGIDAALEADTSDWAQQASKALRRGCPLSVACTMTMVRTARQMALREALIQEYRFISRCMSDGEFIEGIRAAVIDKDRDPRWVKPTLADVTSGDVAHMLAVPDVGDLKLEEGVAA